MESIHEIIGSTGTIVTICATVFTGILAILRWQKGRKEKTSERQEAGKSPIECYLISAQAEFSSKEILDYNIELRLTNPTKTAFTIVESSLIFNPGFSGVENSARARTKVITSNPTLPMKMEPATAIKITLMPKLHVSEIGKAHIDRFDCILIDHLKRQYCQRITSLKIHGKT